MDVSSKIHSMAGLSVAIGGLLFAANDIFFFLISADQGVTGNRTLAFAVLMIAAGLILLGFPALYAAQVDKTGYLGIVSYPLAFIGTLLVFGFAWGGVAIAPEIADEAPEFITQGPELPLSRVMFQLHWLLIAIGYFLLGIASFRAGVLSKWGAVILIAGSVIGLVQFAGFDSVIPVGGPLLAGIGLSIMGFSSLSRFRSG